MSALSRLSKSQVDSLELREAGPWLSSCSSLWTDSSTTAAQQQHKARQSSEPGSVRWRPQHADLACGWGRQVAVWDVPAMGQHLFDKKQNNMASGNG